MLSEKDLLVEYAHACQKQNRLLNFQQFAIYLDTEIFDIKRFFADEKDLKNRFWLNIFDQTMLEVNKTYKPEFSVREKYLAFYYQLFNTIESKRDFIQLVYNEKPLTEPELKDFKLLKKEFQQHIKALYNEGIVRDEIMNRPFISMAIRKLIWFQFLFIMWYWVNDDSENQEHTDAIIQKAVNMLFDFLARNPIDSTLEFSKFLIQHNKLINISRIIGKIKPN